MANFKPFKIIHPTPSVAPEICALPYDVMNRKEASDMAKGKPFSFLHVSRSEIDVPDEVDPYSAQVYDKAKETLAQWIKDGILLKEEQPCYMIYRQTMNGNVQTGVVGCVSVDDYEKNIVKKHEVTRKEKEADRTSHFDRCDANTEPVFLAYRNTQLIDLTVKKWIKENTPIYDFFTEDGIGHTVWLVDSKAANDVIEMAFDDIPFVYIADGHHRAASAASVAKKRRAALDYSGNEPFNFFMAVCFPDFDLRIMDYNRVVSDLNNLTPEELIKQIKASGFSVFAIKGMVRKPTKKHSFCMYMNKQWYALEAQKNILPSDVIGSLDVSILQDKILNPILGINDPRTDKRIDFVGGIRGLKELERRVDSGSAAVAFALCPLTMDELLAVADAGQIMPPKSTWFEPKLGSGLFIHSLKD
ncbi:MAG: DUF1015 domain-containing protein [Clostridia bacterium]|nr:DUF1015 domain-containing protein [Clostridia bacterium]